jgi:hypothetical protein
MSQQNVFPIDRYPPTNALAAAIKHLPQPGPDVPPQAIEIDAGPGFGRYTVTFVVRLNGDRELPIGYWGVLSSERVAPMKSSSGDCSPPASGKTSATSPMSLGATGVLSRLEQIQAVVAPIIGQKGLVALYERSRHLSSRFHPWLADPQGRSASGMDLDALRLLVARQNESEAAAGARLLLKSFHDLLADLVGAFLTRALIGMPPA